jgi:hypothetical protein
MKNLMARHVQGTEAVRLGVINGWPTQVRLPKHDAVTRRLRAMGLEFARCGYLRVLVASSTVLSGSALISS